MTATREREYEVADAQALVNEAIRLVIDLWRAPRGSRAELVSQHAQCRLRRRADKLAHLQEAAREVREESALDRALERQDARHMEEKDGGTR